MNAQPLISCLMATYGRHALTQRALACFLAQDYPNAELIILNNHAVRMALDPNLPPSLAEKIQLYNEPCYASLGACRNRLLDLARGDFVRTWDSDDIYMPWSLSQGVEGFAAAAVDRPSVPAWKPARSWWINGKDPAALAANAMEASILCRADVARKYRYAEAGGDEHSPLLAGIDHEGGIATAELGNFTGYCYMWGYGGHHISGSLGTQKPLEVRTYEWMQAQKDARPRQPLSPDYDAAREAWGRISQACGTDQLAFTERCKLAAQMTL